MTLPLVLVVLGTDHHRFDRLVQWSDAWAGDHVGEARVLVQRGTSSVPVRAESVDFLDHAQLQGAMEQAAVIVSHGGPGTIAESRRQGLMPIVVPRDPGRGEHVDAHQLRFTERLEQEGLLRRAGDAEELAVLLDGALADPDSVRVGSEQVDEVSLTCQRFAQAVSAMFAIDLRDRPARPAPAGPGGPGTGQSSSPRPASTPRTRATASGTGTVSVSRTRSASSGGS